MVSLAAGDVVSARRTPAYKALDFIIIPAILAWVFPHPSTLLMRCADTAFVCHQGCKLTTEDYEHKRKSFDFQKAPALWRQDHDDDI